MWSEVIVEQCVPAVLLSQCFTNVIQGHCWTMCSSNVLGQCFTNVIRGHCFSAICCNNGLGSKCCAIRVDHCCTKAVQFHCCATMFHQWPWFLLLLGSIFQQWDHGSHCYRTMILVMRVACFQGKRYRQTDIDRHMCAKAWKTPKNEKLKINLATISFSKRTLLKETVKMNNVINVLQCILRKMRAIVRLFRIVYWFIVYKFCSLHFRLACGLCCKENYT